MSSRSPGVRRNTFLIDARRDCCGTTRPNRKPVSSSWYPGAKNSDRTESESTGCASSIDLMSLSSFMRKIATTVLPVPGSPLMTIRLRSRASRSSNSPSRMSSTAIAWSGVSALNGESLNRSVFWMSRTERSNTPCARSSWKIASNVAWYWARP